MIEQFLTPEFLKENIEPKLKDPFENTIFKGYYFLSNATKGVIGEKLAVLLFQQKGFESCRQKDIKYKNKQKKDPGWDILVNDIKTEVKISLSIKAKSIWSINHLSIQKSAERIFLICINPLIPSDNKYIWFNKADMIASINNQEKIFLSQQGGKEQKNDDWKCDTTKLLKSSFVKDISEWQ